MSKGSGYRTYGDRFREGHDYVDFTPRYLIRGPLDGKERLYWSNADGWVDRSAATRFTAEEKETYNLPIDNEGWEKAV